MLNELLDQMSANFRLWAIKADGEHKISEGLGLTLLTDGLFLIQNIGLHALELSHENIQLAIEERKKRWFDPREIKHGLVLHLSSFSQERTAMRWRQQIIGGATKGYVTGHETSLRNLIVTASQEFVQRTVTGTVLMNNQCDLSVDAEQAAAFVNEWAPNFDANLRVMKGKRTDSKNGGERRVSKIIAEIGTWQTFRDAKVLSQL